MFGYYLGLAWRTRTAPTWGAVTLYRRDARDLIDFISCFGVTGGICTDRPFGTYATLAIINQPQVAILSTDGIKKRPVVVTSPDGDDTMVVLTHRSLGPADIGTHRIGWEHRLGLLRLAVG